ncbi:biotin transporter BioY [Marinisporobacter balticus]|uniref:BioY family protein n=1 Tax=Marinisporobacter balticus TaxID=2018667 RepID=A0A4R2KX92_9FIRM|nr:biotin transporter BioY [Marinisporobacter balticus]TCO78634.1 BioY family protein [Marinisporobacter balticus]
MRFGKGLGLIFRFIYGYLIGYIFVAVIYIAVAITVILFDPEAFSIFIITYIKTPEYNKLKISLLGHVLMVLCGMVEWMKCKNEIKRKKKKRRKQIYE